LNTAQVVNVVNIEAIRQVIAGIVKKYRKLVALKPSTQIVMGTKVFFTSRGCFSVCVERIQRMDINDNKVKRAGF
jgi:hypothetical protein